MRRSAVILALLLCVVAPAWAQDRSPSAEPPAGAEAGDVDEGVSLIERGVRLLFRGLMSEMEPAMRDLAQGMDRFVTDAEPMLRELARMMQDVSNYHPPEMMPNGDIIIRRKSPLEPEAGEELEI